MSNIEVRMIRHAIGSHMANPDLIAGRSMDATLTGAGITEAAAKGWELRSRNISFEHVVSSPAVRCLQTAQEILKAMSIDATIETSDDLLEMDQGTYVGQRRDAVYNDNVQAQIMQQGRDFCLPGGETMRQVGLRGLRWLLEQSQGVPRGEGGSTRQILAIAHAGLITHTAAQIDGWDHATSLSMLKSMPTVGETIFKYDGNDWGLAAFAQLPENIV